MAELVSLGVGVDFTRVSCSGPEDWGRPALVLS